MKQVHMSICLAQMKQLPNLIPIALRISLMAFYYVNFLKKKMCPARPTYGGRPKGLLREVQQKLELTCIGLAAG